MKTVVSYNKMAQKVLNYSLGMVAYANSWSVFIFCLIKMEECGSLTFIMPV